LVVPGELIVTGGDAAEVLEAAEHRFDAPTLLVTLLIVTDRPLTVPASGYHRDRVLAPQGGSDAIGVIAPVGDEPLHACGMPDQLIGRLHVGGVAGRQDQAERPAENIDERVDLGRPAATRDANCVGFRPPFPPPAQRWALM